MYEEPYYGCAGGCARCPRRGRCGASRPADNPAAADAGSAAPKLSDHATLEDFLQANPGQGVVRIQAFRGEQSIPVENVRVVISHQLDGKAHVFFQGSTDASGLIDPIALPAPKAEEPSPETPPAYASYRLQAEHPAFWPLDTTVDVYDGLKTVQPVALRLRLE